MKGNVKNLFKASVTVAIILIIILNTNSIGSAAGNFIREKDTKEITGINPLVISKIKGGFFGITADIKNDGDYTLDWVIWRITVTGGIFSKINRSLESRIDDLEPGQSETIFIGFIFGIGKITVDVEAWTLGKELRETVEGMQLGFFSIIGP